MAFFLSCIPRHDMMLKQHMKATKTGVTIGDTVMIKAPERMSKLVAKNVGLFVSTWLVYGNKIIVKDTKIVQEDTCYKHY